MSEVLAPLGGFAAQGHNGTIDSKSGRRKSGGICSVITPIAGREPSPTERPQVPRGFSVGVNVPSRRRWAKIALVGDRDGKKVSDTFCAKHPEGEFLAKGVGHLFPVNTFSPYDPYSRRKQLGCPEKKS